MSILPSFLTASFSRRPFSNPAYISASNVLVGNDLRDAVLAQFALNEGDELRAGHRVQLDPAGGPKPVKIPEHEFNLFVGCAVVAQIGDQRGFVALGMVLVLALQPHRGDVLQD